MLYYTRMRMRFYPLNYLFGLFSHDVGIDLGTANTLVWVRNKGVVIREPSVVARHKKTKEILAIGTSAKKMAGKTPANIEVIRPLKDGVVADFDAAAAMLSYYILRIKGSGGSIVLNNPETGYPIAAGIDADHCPGAVVMRHDRHARAPDHVDDREFAGHPLLYAEALAAKGGPSGFDDPEERQRESRTDRPLPGRNE